MKVNITIIIFITIITVILTQPALAVAATLSLNPASGTFNKGCNFALNIDLDTTGTQTDGTDAILLYDQSRFTATTIQNGTIYSDYPGSNIDSANGKITISGLASVSSAFSGKGTLATVNFKVIDAAAAGATQITFDFDPNNKTKTTDSNVVERGTVVDVLSAVTNGSYTIGAGSCVAQASPGPQGATGTATSSATPKNLDDAVGGKTGSETLTFTIAIVGSILTILGILGLAIL